MKVKTILVSQPYPENGVSPYLDLEKKFNVKVTFRQLIRVESLPAKEFRLQHVPLNEHTAVVFNSKIGINNYFSMLKEMRVALNDETKYFCISEDVAHYLQAHINYRKRKVFIAPNNSMADLVALANKHNKESFLVVLPETNNADVIALFDKYKLNYKVAMLYRTVSNDFAEGEELNYDMILMFSPLGMACIKKNFPNYEQGETIFGCLNASTAQAITEAGYRVDIQVPNPQYKSLSLAVNDFLKENHKRR